MNAPDSSASTEGWKARLREALHDDLVEVRYAPLGSGFDFLIVHRPGRRREAIGQFLDALGGPDVPEFDIRTIEQEAAAARSAELRDYVTV